MDENNRDNSSDDYAVREHMWDDQWPVQEDVRGHPPLEPDNLDEELGFPDTVGTRDTREAVRDADPYMPPIDPPVLPGGREGIHVATGFGTSPEEEAYTEPLPRGDTDIRDEIIIILQEDSDTSKLPLEVDVREGVVRLLGEVPSAMDAERAAALISDVRGVVDVIDDTLVVPTAVE